MRYRSKAQILSNSDVDLSFFDHPDYDYDDVSDLKSIYSDRTLDYEIAESELLMQLMTGNFDCQRQIPRVS